MLPIPKLLVKKDLSVRGHAQAGREPAPCVEGRKHKTFKIPKYHGQKVDCIRQILSRDLEEGERNNSLFILYNLLLQNKNTGEYSKKLVIEKNGSLPKFLIFQSRLFTWSDKTTPVTFNPDGIITSKGDPST